MQHKPSLNEIIATEFSAQGLAAAPSDCALKLAGESFLHAAVQQPIDGVTQLVNHVAGKEILPDAKLFAAPKQAKFGTAEWTAETVGSGLGTALPYLLVECATRGLMARTGSLVESAALARTVGASAEGVEAASNLLGTLRFVAPAAKMAANGAIFGLVMSPSSDNGKGFWHERATAAESSAITFGAMGLASRGIMGGVTKLGLPMANPAFNLSLAGIGTRLGVNALGGAVGGVASAESNSLLAGKGAASKEQLAQSVASFMVTGAALDGLHLTSDYYRAAKETAQARAQYAPAKISPADEQMLEKIQKAHFQYFRENSDPLTGLTKDRSTEQSPASIAAVGFSLTAHGVAADHGWISRDDAADYTL